jgi:hypothetical protein
MTAHLALRPGRAAARQRSCGAVCSGPLRASAGGAFEDRLFNGHGSVIGGAESDNDEQRHREREFDRRTARVPRALPPPAPEGCENSVGHGLPHSTSAIGPLALVGVVTPSAAHCEALMNAFPAKATVFAINTVQLEPLLPVKLTFPCGK